MNSRSLRFQLILWYAALLTGVFLLFGAAAYVAMDRSLTEALRDSQSRRARQIAHLVQDRLGNANSESVERVRSEIEESFAPTQNGRFIRVRGRDGTRIYASRPPNDRSFDPDAVPAPGWPRKSEDSQIIPLPGGDKILLVVHTVVAGNGSSYIVETGAPLTSVRSDLRRWLILLAVVLPLLLLVAIGGGSLLVNRALTPVDHIATTAERISSHNLSERLPVPRTGDELERLSVALNHMINRLDTAFQYSRRFMADASHELRTPLTVLRGELESFVEEARVPAEWRERLGSALDEVVRLSHIVEGLFAISRLDAGEAASEWVTFDLGQLVGTTADQMSLLAEDKGIQITCNICKGVGVEGDRARIKQVIVNLLDNAIKYTHPRGRISLTVSAQDNNAVLEVADTGIGIPPEALPRVFERFFRVDKARSRDQGGAGLGLSIVRSICAAHSGRVDVTSTPGQGSCFRVKLPLVHTAPANHKLDNKYEHSLV